MAELPVDTKNHTAERLDMTYIFTKFQVDPIKATPKIRVLSLTEIDRKSTLTFVLDLNEPMKLLLGL